MDLADLPPPDPKARGRRDARRLTARGALGLALLAGCAPARSAPLNPSAARTVVDAAVLIRFAPPRAVTLTSEGARASDTLVVPTTHQLTGRVGWVRGDTLWLLVSSVRTEARGAEDTGQRWRTVVVADSTARVTVLSRHPGALNAVGALWFPVMMATALVALWIVMGMGREGT